MNKSIIAPSAIPIVKIGDPYSCGQCGGKISEKPIITSGLYECGHCGTNYQITVPETKEDPQIASIVMVPEEPKKEKSKQKSKKSSDKPLDLIVDEDFDPNYAWEFRSGYSGYMEADGTLRIKLDKALNHIRVYEAAMLLDDILEMYTCDYNRMRVPAKRAVFHIPQKYLNESDLEASISTWIESWRERAKEQHKRDGRSAWFWATFLYIVGWGVMAIPGLDPRVKETFALGYGTMGWLIPLVLGGVASDSKSKKEEGIIELSKAEINYCSDKGT